MPHVITEANSTIQHLKRFKHVIELGSHPAGQGWSSDVWKGKLQHNEDVVAVKLQRVLNDELDMNPPEREATIWSLLKHPNICPFHGIYYVDDRPALITPWYDNGSANVYLQNRPSVNPKSIIHEITQCVAYLHSRGIVHGDLKGDNIMIDDDGHARIIDFGQSRILTLDLPDVGPTKPGFTLRWCAPELVTTGGLQPEYASDVYSWASTVLELLTGKLPYFDTQDMKIFPKKCNGEPPVVSAKAIKYKINDPNSLCQLLNRCWGKPSTRPSIEEIQDQLQLIL